MKQLYLDYILLGTISLVPNIFLQAAQLKGDVAGAKTTGGSTIPNTKSESGVCHGARATPIQEVRNGAGNYEDLYAAWSPDGGALAVGSVQEGFELVHQGEKKVQQYQGAEDCALTALSCSPDGSWIVTGARGTENNRLTLWSMNVLPNSKVDFLSRSYTLKSPIAQFAWSHSKVGSDKFAYACDNNTLVVYFLYAEKTFKILKSPQGKIRALAWSPAHTSTLAVASDDGKTYLYNLDDAKNISAWLACHTGLLACHTGPVYALSFSPDGTKLASGSADETVCISDVKTKTTLKKLVFKGAIQSVAFSQNGNFLASGQQNGMVNIYDVKEDKSTPCKTGGIVGSLSWTHDDLLASSGKAAHVWNTKGRCLVSIEHPMSVEKVMWKPQGEGSKKTPGQLGVLATVCGDRVVRVFNVQDSAQGGAGPVASSGTTATASVAKGGAGPSTNTNINTKK